MLKHCLQQLLMQVMELTQHPTQALLDIFTIREKKGTIEGLRVSIIGDITHSRVARSNIAALNKMGANVIVYGPRTMMPPGIEQMGVRVASSMDDAVDGADVIMMLRIQMERQSRFLFPSVREYASFFGLNGERLYQGEKRCINNASRSHQPWSGNFSGSG